MLRPLLPAGVSVEYAAAAMLAGIRVMAAHSLSWTVARPGNDRFLSLMTGDRGDVKLAVRLAREASGVRAAVPTTAPDADENAVGDRQQDQRHRISVLSSASSSIQGSPRVVRPRVKVDIETALKCGFL